MIQDSQKFECLSDQELLFQRRFEEEYDLPVYQQWLSINHPTRLQVQREPQSLPNNIVNSSSEGTGDQGEVLQKEFDTLTSAAVHQQWLDIPQPEEKLQEGQTASSEQELFNVSPEQEQLFLKTLENPYFMQWLKVKCPNELAGMKANELGLERSTCVTPCLIAEDQGSSNELTPCLRPSQLNSRAIRGVTPPEHEGELNYVSKF